MKKMFFAILVTMFIIPVVWAEDNPTPCVTSEAVTAEEMECLDGKMSQVDAIMDNLALETKEASKSMTELRDAGGFQSAESQQDAMVLAQRLEALLRDMEN